MMGEGRVPVWARSVRASDDGYQVTVNVGTTHSWVLTDPVRYALAIVRAAQTADHEAAVMRLLGKRLNLSQHQAAILVEGSLRPDRPPYDDQATAPLTFRPAITSHYQPFLALHLHGDWVGDWDLVDGHTHALSVFQVAVTAELDTAFAHILHCQGVGGEEADQVLDAIGDHVFLGGRWRLTLDQ